MSGALVLDSEGLAKAVQRDREVHEWLAAARDTDLPRHHVPPYWSN
ncbi:hypothetical protein [Nocardia carnea]|nr:hypothetical protein [Nocardia carnea]